MGNLYLGNGKSSLFNFADKLLELAADSDEIEVVDVLSDLVFSFMHAVEQRIRHMQDIKQINFFIKIPLIIYFWNIMIIYKCSNFVNMR